MKTKRIYKVYYMQDYVCEVHEEHYVNGELSSEIYYPNKHFTTLRECIDYFRKEFHVSPSKVDFRQIDTMMRIAARSLLK